MYTVMKNNTEKDFQYFVVSMSAERCKIASEILPHIDFVCSKGNAQEAYDCANSLNHG